MTRKTSDGLSPARARLLDAAKQQRFGLKQLSQMIGRNFSYLHQYVHQQSPRALPEEARLMLAQILSVPEAELRDGPAKAPKHAIAATQTLTPAASHALAAAAQGPAAAASVTVALIREGGAAAAESSASFALSDALSRVPQSAVAISLTRNHGALQPRHILICDPGEATRLGDLVAAVCDSTVNAVGILVPNGDDGSMVVKDGQSPDYPATHDSVWRVMAVLTS